MRTFTHPCLQTPVVGEGLATPSGTASVGGAGLETPDMIELRKRRIEADMEGGETPSLPYTVIPERGNARIGRTINQFTEKKFYHQN